MLARGREDQGSGHALDMEWTVVAALGRACSAERSQLFSLAAAARRRRREGIAASVQEAVTVTKDLTLSLPIGAGLSEVALSSNDFVESPTAPRSSTCPGQARSRAPARG